MSEARRTTRLRTLRRLGGRLMRRVGLLPGGVPDSLGQDDQLADAVLPHTVMVYFADTIRSLYQIEQWYRAFREVDKHHRVVVIMKDSRTARRVRADSGLDTLVVARYTTMDAILARSNVKVALYVNHNPENFSNLRFNSLVHASLMHGDSDKGVTVSNQTKAYDFSLVAGQAAVERVAAFSTFREATAQCLTVGRPQIDEQIARSVEAAARPRPAGPPCVLYAPTWEGAQPSAAYGSIDTHGRELVMGFLARGWRVVYRPHPLTGVRSPEYGKADRELRTILAEAEAARPRGHRTDTEPDIARAFADADVMVCDISGVAMDWLPSGKPLVITHPANPAVTVAWSPLTELVPSLRVEDVGRAPELVEQQLAQDPLRAERARLVEYYLGDVTPGASLRRFREAVDHMIEVRDREVVQIARPSQ